MPELTQHWKDAGSLSKLQMALLMLRLHCCICRFSGTKVGRASSIRLAIGALKRKRGQPRNIHGWQNVTRRCLQAHGRALRSRRLAPRLPCCGWVVESRLGRRFGVASFLFGTGHEPEASASRVLACSPGHINVKRLKLLLNGSN